MALSTAAKAKGRPRIDLGALMRVVVVGDLSAHLRHDRTGGRRPHELHGTPVVEKAHDRTHALGVERVQVDSVVVCSKRSYVRAAGQSYVCASCGTRA